MKSDSIWRYQFHLVSLHRGLEGVDRINFSDENASSKSLQRGSWSFTNVAVSGNYARLTGNHDIGGSFDTVGKRFAAAVQVVKFGLFKKKKGEKEIGMMIFS